ncbi:MAG: pyridoxal phosphate-dependent aminotransferase [Gemmobacter sp.]
MRYAAVTQTLKGLGGAKWEIHARARALRAEGRRIIELTIGEPDVPTPQALVDEAARAMAEGRTGYSNGRGEPALVRALANRYTQARGRLITPDQVMCFPGTQTTLYAVMRTLVGPGDEVLVGDPMYATYEGVIAATGAQAVKVPLRHNLGFRIDAADIAERITPASRVIFLNTPHNPTGAVLTRDGLMQIAELARAHDLWILCDEVYEEMVFSCATFVSALDLAAFADRVIVASSISKSHAAPGFRSGWCVGPAEFCARALPLSETMLFGNQPFIADMTALAVSAPSEVAPGMVRRFSARATMIRERLDGVGGLATNMPQAGMFALVDVRAVCPSGEVFARRLLDEKSVAVMPGESFGVALTGWIRLSLTQPDAAIATACDRIAELAQEMRG